MVNAGAIATTSLAPGASPDERWRFIHDGLSRFAGRELAVARDVYDSALATNSRNHAIAQCLRSFDRLYCEPAEAVGLYESSGDWLYEVGLPGKSGIGGGIVTVSPGKGGLGTYAPRLDAMGNSVKGGLAASTSRPDSAWTC
jgi:glutaminase